MVWREKNVRATKKMKKPIFDTFRTISVKGCISLRIKCCRYKMSVSQCHLGLGRISELPHSAISFRMKCFEATTYLHDKTLRLSCRYTILLLSPLCFLETVFTQLLIKLIFHLATIPILSRLQSFGNCKAYPKLEYKRNTPVIRTAPGLPTFPFHLICSWFTSKLVSIKWNPDSWIPTANMTSNCSDGFSLALLAANTHIPAVKRLEDLVCRWTKDAQEESLFF